MAASYSAQGVAIVMTSCRGRANAIAIGGGGGGRAYLARGAAAGGGLGTRPWPQRSTLNEGDAQLFHKVFLPSLILNYEKCSGGSFDG